MNEFDPPKIPPAGAPRAEPQYFALPSDTPAAVVHEGPRKFLGLAVGVVLTLVAVALIAFYIVNTLKNSTVREDRQSKLDEAAQLTAELKAECEAGDTKCEERAQENAARSTGEAQACKGLTGDAYVHCVTLIAHDEKDEKLCDPLSGEDKSACADGAVLVKAKAEKDFTLCASIEEEIGRLSCEATLKNDAKRMDDCGGYKVDAAVCDEDAALKAVVASGDSEGCATLSSEQAETCEDIFTSLDEDGDGLTLEEESSYGTSPTMSDTDGDGYSDREEIETGHDPRK